MSIYDEASFILRDISMLSTYDEYHFLHFSFTTRSTANNGTVRSWEIKDFFFAHMLEK